MEKEQQPPFDEYGTSPLVEGISRLFQAVSNGLINLLNAIWRGFVFSVHFVFSRWIAFGVSMALVAILAFSINYFADKRYVNYMELKPRFSIESQLVNDIGYLNSLIETGNQQKLADVLNLDLASAEQITGIKVETKYLETEKIKFFDSYIATLDSVTIRNIEFKELIADESLESAYSRYRIEVYSKSPDVFENFEEAFLKLIYRNTAIFKEQQEWRENLTRQKQLLLSKVDELDSLKTVVKTTMVKAAEIPTGEQSNIVLDGGMNGASNEYLSGLESIFNRADRYNDEISAINMKLASDGDILKVQTKFTPLGTLDSPSNVMSAVFGALTGFLLYLLVLISKWLYKKGAEV